jgi:hypothetical protein
MSAMQAQKRLSDPAALLYEGRGRPKGNKGAMTMAKEVTEAQKSARMEKRRKAKELARAAGKNWRQLSREERKGFRKQLRTAK